MKKFKIDYDSRGDVLYLVFDKVKNEYGEQKAPNVFLHYDSKTKNVVGITIIGFSKFLKKNSMLKVPVKT